MRFLPMVTILLLSFCASADIFVDFEKGNDRNSGEKTMPLKSFPAAIKKAVPGDTVYLLPSSKPVNAALVVRNKKGLADKPIIIDGMFNTMYGTVRLEEKDCQQVSPGLYLRKLSKPAPEALLLRYFMCFDGKMQRMDRHFKWKKPVFKTVDALLPGEWTMLNDIDIYFKLPAGKSFKDVVVEEPQLSSGVQLEGDCEYLTFRNLIVKFFWNDGFNIHNKCRNITFENVAAISNFDDGVSAHDDCQIFVKNMLSIDNGTGFCHANRAECHHENIYIAASNGRDIMLNNSINTMKNIAVDGAAYGKMDFKDGNITMDDCYFLNLRAGNAIRNDHAVLSAKNSWYCDYNIMGTDMPSELKPMAKNEISAKIKERRDALLKIFGNRVVLPPASN